MEANTMLKRALTARAELVEANAPKHVIGAADAAIDCYKCGVAPPTHLFDVLTAYAASVNRQNRYGKAS